MRDYRHSSGTSAFTLLEAVISMFLLTTVLAMTSLIFASGASRNRITEHSLIAARLGKSQLNRIRSWAQERTGSAWNFDDWSPYLDITETPAAYPDFRVRTRSQAELHYTPCSRLEASRPDPAQMANSYRRVQIDVSRGTETWTFVTLVGDPKRRLRTTAPLEIGNLPSGVVAAGSSVALEARAFDQEGREIPDLTYRWAVQPITGDGRVAPSSGNGKTAHFENRVELTNGSTVFTGGQCRLMVTTKYRGEQVTFFSDPINLGL